MSSSGLYDRGVLTQLDSVSLSTANSTPHYSLMKLLYICSQWKTTVNKRRLGKFKSETGDSAPAEFCGLRSKMYSLYTPTNDSKSYRKAKGVPKFHVRKNVCHQHYLHVLNTGNKTACTFRSFRSQNHVLTTRKITKTCLSCIDDKRYLIDNVYSLAYGHKDIKKCSVNDGDDHWRAHWHDVRTDDCRCCILDYENVLFTCIYLWNMFSLRMHAIFRVLV